MQNLEDAMATATASHAPVERKLTTTREEYQAARADLEARARAGKTVQGRNSKGHFTRGVKVSTFGHKPATAQVIQFRRPANENVAGLEEPRATKTDVHFELLGALVASLPWSRRMKMVKHLDAVMKAAGDDKKGGIRKEAAKMARTLACRAEELAY